ncbi:hypothetical protein EIK77_007262 [Talaromyces pinophilus]|nr:hypothetical protein EIK77_007262 [Talaromyces pinophilus]
MKFTSVITPAVLAACAMALPTSQKRDGSTGPFGVLALRSGSPIHLQSVNAAGQRFWIGVPTATYCPSEIYELTCTKDVEVPGGQQVYVDPSGALAFTQAHSANIPAGAALGPFTFTPGTQFGAYSTSAFGATGFMACPDDAANPSKWQGFAAFSTATVPTGNVGDCLGFDAAAPAFTGDIPAWQYI